MKIFDFKKRQKFSKMICYSYLPFLSLFMLCSQKWFRQYHIVTFRSNITRNLMNQQVKLLPNLFSGTILADCHPLPLTFILKLSNLRCIVELEQSHYLMYRVTIGSPPPTTNVVFFLLFAVAASRSPCKQSNLKNNYKRQAISLSLFLYTTQKQGNMVMKVLRFV